MVQLLLSFASLPGLGSTLRDTVLKLIRSKIVNLESGQVKTLKISDKLHAELTAIVGQLTAKSGEIKTYEDAVEAVLHQSVVMPPELVQEIEVFISKNKQLGYSTKEEFLRGAARGLMEHLTREQRKTAAQTTNQQSQPGAERHG